MAGCRGLTKRRPRQNSAASRCCCGGAATTCGRRRSPAGDTALVRADPRYRDLAAQDIPSGECLKDTVARVMPYWNSDIAPAIASGSRVIIAAHGNSLRALVKYLDGISDADIVSLDIPTGIPLVYELDAGLCAQKRYYLADESELEQAVNAVKKQGAVAGARQERGGV